MSRYVATINVPGYLPMDDEPPIFDTAREAWEYLCEEREREEDSAYDTGDSEAYSETRETLAVLSESAHWRTSDRDTPGADVRAWLMESGINPDGTGTLYGDTPGYEGDHDLGLAYCVSVVEDDA